MSRAQKGFNLDTPCFKAMWYILVNIAKQSQIQISYTCRWLSSIVAYTEKKVQFYAHLSLLKYEN